MIDQERPLRDTCKWCGAPIYWLKYPRTGNLAPITMALNERGNVAVDLEAGTYSFLPKDAVGVERRLNHWADCPNAKDHAIEKKRKAKDAKAIERDAMREMGDERDPD
jgi:hypothetical protein